MVQNIVIQLFQTKSFDNVWYWVLLAIAWSLMSYWTFGVGHHEAVQARRNGGEHLTEFETIVGIYCKRVCESLDRYGTFAALAISFILAMLATLGFWFWILFAQALFLLVAPLMAANVVTLIFACRQDRAPLAGKALIRRYRNLRMLKQAIGVFTIMTASAWGALINLGLTLS